MSAAATPSKGSSHIDVTPGEFERRLAAYGHSESEIHRLWDELAASEAAQAPGEERTLGLGSMIAVYLGALLVVAAFASLLGMYWETLDPWGVLALGATYLVGFVVTSEVFRRRRLVQPASVLEAAAVGFVAVVAYAVERITGFWPHGASNLDYIHRGITGMAVAGLVVGLVLLALRPDPLVLVPLGVGTGLLAADLAELLFGNDTSRNARLALVLPVGLAWIAAGLWLDVERHRAYATWAHWVGLAATVVSIGVLMPKTVPGFAVIGALGALALFFSAFVRHWSFTVIGALAVLVAAGGAMGTLGRGAPIAVAILGVLFIVIGVRWSHWREPIREAVLTRLPARAQTFVMRLAP